MDFEARMTEIRSRSRMRMERRKKRRATVCVSLALCLCIGVAVLLPEYQAGIAADATQSGFGSVTVNYGGQTCVYTAADTVSDIRRLIETVRREAAASADTASTYAEDNIQLTSASIRYTIVLEDEFGDLTEYILTGNLLKETATEKEYAISRDSRWKLLELLELPH